MDADTIMVAEHPVDEIQTLKSKLYVLDQNFLYLNQQMQKNPSADDHDFVLKRLDMIQRELDTHIEQNREGLDETFKGINRNLHNDKEATDALKKSFSSAPS